MNDKQRGEMMRLRVAIALLAGASFAGIAYGQTGAPPPSDTPGAATANVAPNPNASAANQGLADIVVTAQRREENIQRVPVAVTAIGSARLDELRAVNVKDIAGIAPGLQVENEGLASNPVIIIRGIPSGVSSNSVDPKVGIYLDGVYIGRTVGSLFDLADIQRVEVLRGPQGTLFGRNATAGAISLTTAAPSGELHIRGSVSYGNYDAKRGKVTVDLPSFGPFSVKVAYLHDDIDGDYRNTIGGRILDETPSDPSFGKLRLAKRLGGHNIDGGQIAVRGDFGNLTADYRFDYTDQRAVGRAIQAFGRVPDGSDALAVPIDNFQGPNNILSQAFGFPYAGTGGTPNISTTRLTQVANATSSEHVVTQGHSLTLAMQATDSLLLKSITAFRKFRQYPNIYDLGATGGERFSTAQLNAFLGASVNPLSLLGIAAPAAQPDPNNIFFSLLTSRKTNQSQVSEEFQGQWTRPGFEFTGGIFVFHERSPATDLLGIFYPADGGVVNVNDPLQTTVFGGGTTKTVAINNSFAGYGQLTVHVTDKIDVAGGVRGTIDDRLENILQISAAQIGNIGLGRHSVTYKKATYTGIVTYRPTSNINAYAKVATGYDAGGIYSGIAYKPESLTSYEGGIKSQFLNNRVRVNLAGFYQQYKDLQLQQFANGVSFFQNAGRANFSGFEAEMDVTPIHGLVISGNLDMTTTDYKKYFSLANETNGVPYNIAGVARTPYVAKWTGLISLQYDAPTFSNGSHLYGHIDANYRSHYYLTATPYTVSGNPTIGPNVPVEAYNRQPSYWLLNGRLGLANYRLGGSTLTLSGFGRNLLNKHYVSFGAPVEALVGTYERGRTYGIELGFDFK